MGVLEGKTALITGATRGIGRGIAEDFLRQGARVTVTGRSEEKGKLFLEEVDAGDNAHFIPGDAGNQRDVEGSIEETIERYGHLDIMVVNAGGPIPALFKDVTDEAYHQDLAFNLHQYFWATRAAVNHMVPRGSGRIIAISSIEGKVGMPAMSIYSIAKSGIHGMVKAVAKEIGQSGVTINAVCPGVVLTDNAFITGPAVAEVLGLESVDQLFAMVMSSSAIGRVIEVDECSALVTFLASDASSGITGGVINVDGGTLGY